MLAHDLRRLAGLAEYRVSALEPRRADRFGCPSEPAIRAARRSLKARELDDGTRPARRSDPLDVAAGPRICAALA